MRTGFYTLITPEYTPEEIITQARTWGFDGIEWRVATPGEPKINQINYWNGNRCTLDVAELEKQLPGIVQKAEAAGLATVSLCPYYTCSELDKMDRILAIAAECGVDMVRVSADRYDRSTSYQTQFDRMRREAAQLTDLARNRGVRICMLQHAGTLIPSASACRRLVDHLDPKHFGLYLDVGHFVREGYEDFGIVLDLLKDYIAEIHLRNGWLEPEKPTEAGFIKYTPRWGPLDSGHVDLALLAQTLGSYHWQGWLMLEDFSHRPTDVRMTEGLQTMRRMIAIAAEHTPDQARAEPQTASATRPAAVY